MELEVIQKPTRELFLHFFQESKRYYTELYEITSNLEYKNYLSRRFRYKADLEDFQCKIKEIREHLDTQQKSWDVQRELYHLKILRHSEYRVQKLLENPILENPVFEEWTIRKNNLTIQLHSSLQQIKLIWNCEIPIYLLQKDNIDEILYELQTK